MPPAARSFTGPTVQPLFTLPRGCIHDEFPCRQSFAGREPSEYLAVSQRHPRTVRTELARPVFAHRAEFHGAERGKREKRRTAPMSTQTDPIALGVNVFTDPAKAVIG
jgi:hypothetical protein